jgi:hypothetical protein
VFIRRRHDTQKYIRKIAAAIEALLHALKHYTHG